MAALDPAPETQRPPAEPATGDDAGSGFSALALLVVLGVVALGAALVFFVHPLNDAVRAAASGDTKELRRQLRDLGVGGVLVLLGIVLTHAIIPYPAEIPLAAAGFVYGFWGALPISITVWVISALATYTLGRYAGRPLLYRLAGEKRFRTVERTVARGGVTVLLAARLVPIVPFSLIGYVSGATGVNVKTFAWTTAVGFLPLTIIVTLLGSRLESLSATDPVLYLALAPVLVLLAVAHPLAKRLQEGQRED